MTLSDRRGRILGFIVDDYVDSAQPIGSQSLVARHNLSLSAATVRNEMAALEDEGLITHPHTSAGRVPSNRGYRYYVSSLMDERELTRQEQVAILHQFHQSARQVEEWAGLAASVLARAMHSVALVTQPTVLEIRLKQLQLVELEHNRALLIVVTSDATVRQLQLEFPVPAQQDQLTRLATRLNAELGGRLAADIPRRESAEAISGIESIVVAAVSELLLREQWANSATPVVEGVRELLRQPEFGDADRMLDTLEAVEESRLRVAIPSAAVDDVGVAIVIGDENHVGPYQDMRFVLARYGSEGTPSGVLGLLGPTRMPYADAVAHVRYVSDVLSELMRKFYTE